MKIRNIIAATSAAALLAVMAGCSKEAEQEPAVEEEAAATTDATGETAVTDAQDTESFEITTGLTARILRAGDGQVAQAGDNVVVHYTGWLYDESAENNRGDKFDSSVDRNEHFQFPLGAGRVIKGWDQGVEGMAIGEVRELTIAPEMGYGERGAGNVIPPGATLVFEVELFELQN
ncbi:MAG: FKBP-type peptidyl-prolyl cis-trans isomerase [Woeseiaceae bacterium]